MIKKFSLAFLLFSLFSFNGFSQTGPGGVGSNDGSSNLVMWFRPDNGIVSTGSLVDSWENSAGYASHNLTTAGALRPTVIPNVINGYNEISFNGNNNLNTGLNLTATNFIQNQASSFVFARADNTYQSSSVYTTSPLVGSTRFTCHIPWSNTVYFDIGTCCSNDSRIEVSGLTNLTSYSIWAYDAHPTTGKQLYRNETLLQSRGNTTTYNSYASQRFNLGGYVSGTDGFVGDITEVIVYRSKINQAQRIIVDNYLSAKYNTALTANNLYLQDNPANGNFDHNVAGIARINGSTHLDSQGTGIVRMSNPSGLSGTSDKYLFWGEDTKGDSYAFNLKTTDYKDYLNSKWRISKGSGNIGNVDVEFDITNLPINQFCKPLQLVIDNDSDFSSPTNVYNLSISSGKAKITGVTFNNNDYFTLRYVDQIIWDGTTYHNGSGVLEAPNASDACLKFTVKSGVTAILTNDVHVREIVIETGSVLQVNDGLLLETENQVVINGELNLLGEAQLIQNHTGVTTNSGIGQLRINQQGTLNLYNYNYWSSPVNRGGFWKIKYLEEPNGVVNFAYQNDANPLTTPITLSSKWLYGFNAVEGNYYGWGYLGDDTNIKPGIGYTMKGSGTIAPFPLSFTEEDYIFKGMPNNGDYSYPVVAGNDFLIGNPYPSALNATQFINDNLPVIDGTLYFWEQFAANNTHVTVNYQGGYATLNLMMGITAMAAPDINGGISSKGIPKNDIPVGQGFFVNIENGGNLVFNNAQRVFAKESLTESTFFRTSSSNVTNTQDSRIKYWLSFSDPSGREREIGLGYDSNASIDYDKGYDARDYNGFPDNMYWVRPNEKLIIQALNTFAIEDEIPLGIKITTSGTYTIGLSDTLNFPIDIPIYLKDNQSNTFYDLKNSNVSLFFEAGVDENKYSIVYQQEGTLNVNDLILDNDLSVTYNGDSQELILHGFKQLNNITSLNVYNMLGQQLLSLNELESNRITLPNVSNGVYIVEIIESGKGKFTQKFIID